MDDRMAKLRALVAVQGGVGNWSSSPYALGLYNGLELALATLEGREPAFKPTTEDGELAQVTLDEVVASEIEGSAGSFQQARREASDWAKWMRAGMPVADVDYGGPKPPEMEP